MTKRAPVDSSLRGREGNQLSARRGWGVGVCYKSRDAFVQPAFYLAGNSARNGVDVVAFKNMFI